MMMTTMKDEWIRAAMTDDMVVVELLLRLKQSHASPPLLTPFKWGLRLPRSRPSTRCDAVSVRKDREPTRCSPTTPLSWSGGASPSAAADADAFEDSSRSSSIRFAASRSKSTALGETTTATTTKRSRRKKTFAELKDEESLLLKERTYLKKELATLRVTFKEQRATNESLKRMKLDLGLNSVKSTSAATDEAKEAFARQPYERESSGEDLAPSIPPAQATSNDLPLSDSCQVKKEDSSRGGVFMLPDLNMMASEEDYSGSERLYEMS